MYHWHTHGHHCRVGILTWRCVWLGAAAVLTSSGLHHLPVNLVFVGVLGIIPLVGNLLLLRLKLQKLVLSLSWCDCEVVPSSTPLVLFGTWFGSLNENHMLAARTGLATTRWMDPSLAAPAQPALYGAALCCLVLFACAAE